MKVDITEFMVSPMHYLDIGFVCFINPTMSPTNVAKGQDVEVLGFAWEVSPNFSCGG